MPTSIANQPAEMWGPEHSGTGWLWGGLKIYGGGWREACNNNIPNQFSKMLGPERSETGSLWWMPKLYGGWGREARRTTIQIKP